MKILLFCLLTLGLFAQEAHNEKHHSHKHHVEVFLGGAKEYRDIEKQTHVFGLEYQYRLNETWAVGGAVETLGNQTERERAYTIAASFYATPAWQIFAGPGYEVNEDGHGVYYLRVGTGYGFNLGNSFTLTPKLMVDAIEGNGPTLIAGFALGYGF